MLAFLAEAFATITLGAIVFGGHLSRVKMSGEAIFLGSNCPGGEIIRRAITQAAIVRGQSSRGQLSEGWAIIRVAIFLGGNFPDTVIF